MINNILIDNFFDQEGYNRGIVQKLQDAGFNAISVSFYGFPDEIVKLPKLFKEEPFFVYGTIQFVKHITKHYSNAISFYSESKYNVSEYLTQAPLDFFLNKDAIFSTFGLVKNNFHYYANLFPNKSFFMKPNSGGKTFTGFVITSENHKHEFNSLDKISSAVNNTLVALSPTFNVMEEYRFMIIDQTAVSGSKYFSQQKLDMSPDVPQNVLDFAQTFADLPLEQKPDIAFGCDVGVLEDGSMKVVELNAISTADFYMADPVAIFKALQIAYQKELDGEF